MSAEVQTLYMWLVFENERSLIVADAATNARREFCLPRSLVERLRKFPRPNEPLTYRPVEFTLPAWKVEQEQLGSFVVS